MGRNWLLGVVFDQLSAEANISQKNEPKKYILSLFKGNVPVISSKIYQYHQI